MRRCRLFLTLPHIGGSSGSPLLRSLLYLLQLTVVSSLILTAAYSFRLIPQFDHFLSWAETALPPFRVENGQLHVDVESPASFQYPGNHLVTFVFDTREKHIVPESLDQPALLFTREVLFLPFLGQPITWPWPQVETLFSNSEVGITVNPETLEEMRRSLSWMTPAFFLFSLGISMFSQALPGCAPDFFWASWRARLGEFGFRLSTT